MLEGAFEAGVVNPRWTAIFTLSLAICACVFRWLWQPFGPVLTPISVFLLWLLTAAGVLGVIKGYIVKGARLKRLRAQEEIEHLHELTWQQFEQVVADAYRAKGYRVEQCGGNGDGGIDLLLRSATGELVAVQCKRWKDWQVGAPRIREFVGAMAQKQITSGIFVTSGKFSQPAKEAAAKTRVQLVDGRDLIRLIQCLP
jgi:restriction system protein